MIVPDSWIIPSERSELDLNYVKFTSFHFRISHLDPFFTFNPIASAQQNAAWMENDGELASSVGPVADNL